MSSSFSSNFSLIVVFQNASFQINRYLAICIFLFGLIGNVANIVVLSQRHLRSNPCSYLFLLSSVANFIAICSGLLSRFLSTFSIDLTNTSQFLCKFRAFLVFSSITAGFWLIGLASLDRWLASSNDANRRRLSTLKYAKRNALIVVISSIIIQAHHLYCFEANISIGPIQCYTRTVLCRLFSDLTYLLGAILFPLIFMVIFSILTILNVRQSKLRVRTVVSVMPTNNIKQSSTNTMIIENQQKKANRQLLVMLTVQASLTALFTFPITIVKLYTTITADTSKSALQNTIETFFFNLFLLLYYVACGMPFYIYTLSGGVLYRKGISAVLRNLKLKLKC